MLKILRYGYFYITIALTALIVLPVFIARPFNPKNTSFFFFLYSRVTGWALGLKYEEFDRHNMENNRPAIMVGNHQHNFDAYMASMALKNKVVFLGKKELLYIPFVGIAFFLGGNVFVDRSNRKKAMKSLEKVKKQLSDKNLNVGIFPEGTRNPTGTLLPFKLGAFHTAIQTQLPIIPYAVSRYALNMDLNKLNSGKILVKYLPPISTKGMKSEDAPKLANQAREAIEEALKELDQKM